MGSGTSSIFKTKWFDRFSRKEDIADDLLLAAVVRAERGEIDADLGSGVIKQRVARSGQGRSGGYRAIVFFRRGERVVFVYGFAKSDRENIDARELKEFKRAARRVLALSDAQVRHLVNEGDFVEVRRNG